MKAPMHMETAAAVPPMAPMAVPRGAPLRARPGRVARRRARAEAPEPAAAMNAPGAAKLLALATPPLPGKPAKLLELATPPLAVTPEEAEAAFGMSLRREPGGKVDWDAIDAALAEGKRERIAAVQRMIDRWHWNKRDQCWEKKGPA